MPRVPPPGKRFQKGQTGNPLGAAIHNKDLKKVRHLTHEDLSTIGTLILESNIAALEAIKANPDTTALRVWFCSVALKAIEKGDAQSLNVLLDRIVGKVSDKVQVTGNGAVGFTVILKDYSTPPPIEVMSDPDDRNKPTT
jgi:hypothetical protein